MALVQKRGLLRKKVTESHKKFCESLQDIDRKNKLILVSKLNSLETDLKELNSKILEQNFDQDSKSSSDLLEKEFDECLAYDDKILEAKADMGRAPLQ